MRILIILLFLAPSLAAQDFASFLARIDSLPESSRASLVDSLLQAVGEFPYSEKDTLVHFLYRGAAAGVTLAGDMNAWDGSSIPLSRISTTDLWYCTRSYEPDARLDYKFILDGSRWILDPRNPHQVTGGFGPNSELRMPRYLPPAEIDRVESIPHGRLFDTTIVSAALGNSRSVRVYLPPGYDTTGFSYPVALFHDGLEYLGLASAQNILDNLIAARRIRPVIGLFVPPVNRTAEYAGNQIDAFSDFIALDLLGWLDGRFRTVRDPRSRATLGASNGGNISLYLGLKYPGIFGNVAAQSSNIVAAISAGYANSPKREQKIYLDLGTYDLAVLIPMVHDFVPILRAKGYDHLFREYHEGHSWGSWRAHIDDALAFFYPFVESGTEEQGSADSPAGEIELYPNPLRVDGASGGVASIRFRTGSSGEVSVGIFDMLGRKVGERSGMVEGPGLHTLTWSAEGCAPGMYFCSIASPACLRAVRLMLIR